MKRNPKQFSAKKCIVCGSVFTPHRKDQVGCGCGSVANHKRKVMTNLRIAESAPVSCERCGKQFRINRFSGRRQRFCSRKCVNASYGKGLWVVQTGRTQFERQHDWYVRNRAKAKENNFLYNLFGTSLVPMESRTSAALIKIGKSIFVKNVDQNIINRVLKGETYAAYE